jgi:hypothetical protein
MSGFYITLARFTETLGVEPDPPMDSALIRGIAQRVSARKAQSQREGVAGPTPVRRVVAAG